MAPYPYYVRAWGWLSSFFIESIAQLRPQYSLQPNYFLHKGVYPDSLYPCVPPSTQDSCYSTRCTMGKFYLLLCSNVRRSISMQANCKDLVSSATWSLLQPASWTDSICSYKYLLWLCHPIGTYSECVGPSTIHKRKVRTTIDFRIWYIVSEMLSQYLLSPNHLMWSFGTTFYTLDHLTLDSGCIFSIARLVEFARKRPKVEGVLDVTWAYYSTGLVR